jgi:hypothetical protein
VQRTVSKVVLCTTALILVAGVAPATADPDAPPVLPPGAVQTTSESDALPTDPVVVEQNKREELLGKGWQSSGDRLWTTAGDTTGFHLMVAEAKTGYSWRVLASLSQPGVESDLWIGNACVTGSGDRAVVVYAPRTYTNKEDLMARGAFTATVDLTTGAVAKLPVRTTLAYYNPGCGLGETAVLTQDATADLGKTGLLTVDAASGKLGKRVEVTGQVTSAVPTTDGIVGVAGGNVARFDQNGARTRLANVSGAAFALKPDAQNGLVYLEGSDVTNQVRRIDLAKGKTDTARTLATGKAGRIGLASTVNGKVFITGAADKVEALPGTVTTVDVPANAELSTRGEAAVTDVRRADGQTPGAQAAKPGEPLEVHLKVKSTKTGGEVGFTVDPADMLTPRDQDMSEADATCAVRRNDVAKQVYQPKPKQVEWAADQAVAENLQIKRPQNWHGNGLRVYHPQSLFSPYILRNTNETGRVPAQVLLGILGQESNLWQASRHVLPGEYSNPLIGNYYGNEIYNDTEDDDWNIDFSKADCGYGVSQMTDGMRLAGRGRPNEVPLSPEKQIAVATDYATNIAAGLQLLTMKWNQVQDAGVKLNNNDPSKVENWFAAVWAYNSGYHEPGSPGSDGASGLGWGNNPANTRYPANRGPFGADPRDFAHPQQWPYPEKVLGFAANPPSGFEDPLNEVPFFRAAWWNGTNDAVTVPGSAQFNRATVKPPRGLFCTSANNCDMNGSYTPNNPDVIGEPAGPCAHKSSAGLYDLKCWWHSAVTWKPECALTCGNEFIRYDPDADPFLESNEPANGSNSFPICGEAFLPVDALVVDDVSRMTEPVSDSNCRRTNFADGSFTVEFGKNAAGQESARMDLHQATSGYGAHYWFSHTNPDTPLGRQLEIKATWTLGRQLTTPSQVWVHQPAPVARTNRAPLRYVVNTANGPVTVGTDAAAVGQAWINLGTFPFNNAPSVTLSSINGGGDGKEIGFDSVAFVPPAGGVWTGDSVVKMTNNASGRCLAIANDSLAAGARAVQRPCNNGFGENWAFTLLRVHRETVGANDFMMHDYVIKNRNSGKCLAVVGARLDEPAPVDQQDCVASRHQKWSLTNSVKETPDNFRYLRNVNSNFSVALQTCGAPDTAIFQMNQDRENPTCGPGVTPWRWKFSVVNP